MLITGLYKADEMVAVYSHVDRMVTLGCMPVHEEVSIDKGIDVWANFGTHYFLERREIGIFNIGDGAGTVTGSSLFLHNMFFSLCSHHAWATVPSSDALVDLFSNFDSSTALGVQLSHL